MGENNEMENGKRQKTENRKRKVERGEEGRKESEMKENHQPIDSSTGFYFYTLKHISRAGAARDMIRSEEEHLKVWEVQRGTENRLEQNRIE